MYWGGNWKRNTPLLREVIPDAAIVTHPYTDPEAFYRGMQDADGLLTAFIPLDKTALDHMPALKAISINATGYNFVDLEETTPTRHTRYAQSESAPHGGRRPYYGAHACAGPQA